MPEHVESRRSARPRPAADAPQAAPALVGRVAPRRPRAALRPRVHADLDRDPAAHAARDRRRDRRITRSALAVHPAIIALAVSASRSTSPRRYATARIGIRIEARMRELLYQAYLRYPRAFYDRHATGQVLSRATNDLYPIRYFIGWGLVQGIQSLMMIVGSRDRARDRQPAARALHRRCDAADHGARAALRAARVAAVASGAGTQGRRDGGCRRGGRRNRDGAGVRPRGRRARPLRRARARPSATPCSARPASRRGTSRGSTTCRRSRSPPSSTSADAR